MSYLCYTANMGKGDIKSKIDRTNRLTGLLRSDDFWTTTKLAKKLDISHRTLMRDLRELKESGYPIESDRGRGGGIRLNGRWGIDRINMTNKEAIQLLLCLSVTESLTPKGNDLGAKALKQKIANIFPEPQRKAITELRKRLLIGNTASVHIVEKFEKPSELIWERVMLSFFESKKITLEYTDGKLEVSNREFDPHFLLLNWPIWYLLGWDYLRQDVRIFRIDRIKKIDLQNKTIVRRPRSVFLEAYEEFFYTI